MCQAQINPNDFFCLGHVGSVERDHNVQPPAPIVMPYEVRCIDGQTSIRGSIGGRSEGDCHPSCDGREAYRPSVPGQRVSMHIVPWRTGLGVRTRDLESGFLPCKCRLQSCRGLDTRLDDEVRDQARARGFLGVVCRVVQLHTVLLGVCPAVGTHPIKRSGELLRGVSERLSLFGSWLELQFDSSLHTQSVPYTTRFCNISQRLCRGKRLSG